MTPPRRSTRRYFTVDEANAMIPRLEIAFGRLIQLKAQIRVAFSHLEKAGFAPESDEFDVDPEGADADVVQELATLRTLVDALKADVRDLHEAGCIVKDIDEGLVDWYSLHGAREVFLCWKLGEKEVAWWHDVDAGFAGRRPVGQLEA